MTQAKDLKLPVLAAYDVPPDGRYALHAHIALVRVFALMEDEIARLLSGHDLTMAHFEILLNLSDAAGLTQQELAERMLVTKANVCITLDKMEKLGLAERRPDPTDRRINRIHPTPKGRALLAKVRPIHARYIEKVMSALEPSEQKTLYRSLTRLEFAIKANQEDPATR